MALQAKIPSPIQFAPGYDPVKLASHFGRFSRLHLPDILSQDSALRISEALCRPQDWSRSTLGAGKPIDLRVAAIESGLAVDQEALTAAAHLEARDGFHYLFDSVRISEIADRGEPVDADFLALYHWLNSESFLSFVSELSGLDGLSYVDAQATRFLPGHYLNVHDDDKPGSGRELAYVLNFTPRWRPEWGGLLGFMDADDHLAEAYAPVFNGLNIFRVPQRHLVTSVAPFAGRPRLSVTGWIRRRR